MSEKYITLNPDILADCNEEELIWKNEHDQRHDRYILFCMCSMNCPPIVFNTMEKAVDHAMNREEYCQKIFHINTYSDACSLAYVFDEEME